MEVCGGTGVVAGEMGEIGGGLSGGEGDGVAGGVGEVRWWSGGKVS